MVLAAAVVLSGLVAAGTPAQAAPAAPAVEVDSVAQTYYEVLLRHTQFAESKWEEANGRYTTDSYFGESLVLGNAVLLTRGDYNAETAGVSKATLLDHTVRSISYFAATNRFNGGTLWGKNLFWEATYESYFVAAAHLLWDDLDATTRANVLNISKGQADYTVSLGTDDDSGSGGWSPNGLSGGYKGDTKLEEMGVYALGIAPALAYNSGDANESDWSKWMGTWVRNMTGLPVADKNTTATVGGVPVSDNTAQNLYPSYLVENHDSFAPHYQQELWRTMARGSIHFLLEGKEVPQVLRQQVNGNELLSTILQDTSDSGEPFMVTVQDREYLYGRDVIPLAYLAQVQGNKYVARAEADLAAKLLDFQAYGVAPRIAYKTIGAQTAGEIKYEGEARAELAIAYLLHEYRAASDAGPVQIASEADMFAHAAGASDYGASRPGLLMQQSENAWAATVDRSGFVKFAWQPEHDDWLFKVSGSTPFFLPTANPSVNSRYGRAYNRTADGFDGTASLLDMASGRAGMTTLPTGTVAYSTTGTSYGEGVLNVRNLDMGSVRGLDGDRSYTTAEGETVFTNQAPATDTSCTKPSAATRRDCLTFEPVTARYLRVQGINRTSSTNYSLREVAARNGKDGENLLAPTMTATERVPGASVNLPAKAIDGDISTYWTAASTGGGAISDTDWWQVDLGQDATMDRVVLDWGTAPAAAFAVQVSANGTDWQSVSYYGIPASVSTFERTQARYVRYQGVAPHASYGYSIREFEVHDGDGADLAQQPGVVASASSEGTDVSPQRLVGAALDKNFGTWWSVAKSARARADSWYQLDLGSPKWLDKVMVFQEVVPVAYQIQLSTDGVNWRSVDFQAPGAARVDNAAFGAPVQARYLRMQGEVGNAQYGYSLYEMQAGNGAEGANLAAGKTATASSQDAAKPASMATDDKLSTRWAVAAADRGQADTWLQVDLGSAQTIDRARLVWETPGLAYHIETSIDGEHWTNQYDFNAGSSVSSSGGWLTVDDRASFVVTGSHNPIQVVSGGAVSIDRVSLSAGAAAGSAGMVVEGYAKTGAEEAARLAARTKATAADSGVTVSDADGYLSLFNLGADDVTTEVTVPHSGDVRLYQGTQTIGAHSSKVGVSIPGASSRVLPTLFTISGDTTDLVAKVVNGRRLNLTAPAAGTIIVAPLTGQPLRVDLVAGDQTVQLPETSRPYPLADLAAGKISYPSSPLPTGMSDPDFALDDNLSTVWTPGAADGRMVVDLGAQTDLGTVRVIWNGSSVPAAKLFGSADGLSFAEIGTAADGIVSETPLTGKTARYVALQVSGWQSTNASVATLAVYPAGADPVQVADELVEPINSDKTALQASVDAASALVASDYTTSSWADADLESALEQAHSVLGDRRADQTVVDGAASALADAIALLVTRGDPTALTALVGGVEALDGHLAGFSEESVATLTQALGDAKAVLAAAADKSQADLDGALSALRSALGGLTAEPAAVDTTVLKQVHDSAAAMSNTSGRYTADSWSALQDAIGVAAEVLADNTAGQDRVDEALAGLTSAMSRLTVVVDRAVLGSVLDVASALTNTDGRYTADSWSRLQTELARARAVHADASASQAKVDAAVAELSSAVASLTPTAGGNSVPSQAVVTQVKLNQSQLRLVKGKSFKLLEGVYYTNLQASYTGQVRWSSSKPAVATVSGAGTLKARRTGSTTITVTSIQPGAGGKTLSTSITVTVVKSKAKSRVAKVTASVPKTLARWDTAYVTGRYSSSNATGVKVTYRSTKPSVASIDSVGRIIARAKGTATIVVKAGGKSHSYKIKVG